MWLKCECSHWRGEHQRLDYSYGGCRICSICGKFSSEHVFVSHQFTPCACAEYQESA